MSLSASERLRRFYGHFSGENQVLVLINADPDAIASAMAVKRLLWRKTAGVTISNINVIKRPDNVAMVRLLKVALTPVDEVEALRFNRVVIVDSQPDHHPALAAVRPDVIIDHHPETQLKAPLLDIRPKYGATASIMTEYLRAARIKPATKLATALFLAIKTDTSNFERQTSAEDIRAFQFLFRYANIQLARKIEQADLRLDFLRYFKVALQDMCIRQGRVFVHLGPVVNPDVCVLVADFFMRVNPVTWSIISGVYDNKLIVVFRNDGLRKKAGLVAKLSLGAFGSAGGHKSMARAEIPLAAIRAQCAIHNPKQLAGWIIDRIEKKAEKKKVEKK